MFTRNVFKALFLASLSASLILGACSGGSNSTPDPDIKWDQGSGDGNVTDDTVEEDKVTPPDTIPEICKSDADCDDGNPCTDGTCGTDGKCLYTNNTTECDDGDMCTEGDVCADGVCLPGTAKACDDGNACTDDTCDPATGCAHTNNTAGCDDGDACTNGDTCVDGVCVATDTMTCKDDNPCTDDTCDPEKGCVFENNTAACDDGNLCTIVDTCKDGKCAGTLDPNCKCVSDADCEQFEDGNPCNGTLICKDEVCEVDPATLIACLDEDLTDCFISVCDVKTGDCIAEDAPDGTNCEDGDACTSGDKCQNKVCVPGQAVTCNDNNVCTNDSCDKEVGCIYADNTDACDDGNACTENDVCFDGVCAGTPIVCNDNNLCTDDTCNPSTGCEYVANTVGCNDGNACTENDTCIDKECKGTTVACDDTNPCTDNTCDPATGCVTTNNTSACDDGNACTEGDKCQDGSCVPGTPKVCDDNNPCTSDTCVPAAGCVYVNNSNPCVNLNACSENDVCQNGVCADGPAINCDDGNPCTTDTCDPTAGCKHGKAVDGTVCNDGNNCTTGDKCTGGKCAGTGPDCNDNNPCTDDKCDNLVQGCYHVNNDNAKCSDNSVCTFGDKCSAGVCKGTPIICNDNNPCTNDSCDPVKGCQYVNNTANCDDGNPCTTLDKCSNGVCSGIIKLCFDGNPCTDDKCDMATGNCVYTANTAACDDKNACTSNDKCINKVCIGTVITCNDNNVCTTDTCDVLTGCKFTPNAAACDDGNYCNGSDVCANGSCKSGTANLCTGCGTSSAKGCNGCACEKCVCAIDPFCCNTAWDSTCVAECKDATICPQSCQYNGCNTLPIKGCGNCPCQAAVCAKDSWCCNVNWDNACATACKEWGSACGNPGGAGCGIGYGNEPKGCGGCACEKIVCAVDSFCCNNTWDSICVDECKNVASAHCAKTGGRGCQIHSTKGCNGCPCQTAVCASDPWCCNVAWDNLCVQGCIDKGFICK